MSAGPAGAVRTLFFGSGGFAVPILDALLSAPEVAVVGVVSAPDRPAGRRAVVQPTPVAARAGEAGIALLQPTRIRDSDAIEALAALRPELGVLADYGRIVPPAILDLPAHGILNVHPSLLPRHRGASPIPATILADDRLTGVTVIRMDPGLDSGPILATVEWPLDGTETAPELEARAAAAGADLLGTILRGWLDGSIAAVPQDPTAATMTRPLRRRDGRLDPDRPAAELARMIRAFEPWPGTYLDTVVGPLKILRATAIPGRSDRASDAEPGTFADGPELRLATTDGDLQITGVQPAGGRAMTGAELVRGRPGLAGSRVVRSDDRPDDPSDDAG